ncbi:MAG: enoyl-CoA hydratase-related protein [Actinomycetota bacterium]|nr:enoyl-CoA hydratase-related protein [Actinomycetota bacterium]
MAELETGSATSEEAPPAVLVERDAPIATVTMNRPEQLNALSNELMSGVVEAMQELDRDRAIRAIVLTGSERAFAAGADIKEMSSLTPIEFAFGARVEQWDALRAIRTPLLAAVSGHCLGGGCELAMICDIVIASETASFGQPETGVGIIPGAGGTQRLVRAIGKPKAMDVILSGRRLDAAEAERAGLVSRVVTSEMYLREAQDVARRVATRAPIAQRLAKEAVDRAADMGLADGLAFERKSLYLAFASEDAHEGLAAFSERRSPRWSWK